MNLYLNDKERTLQFLKLLEILLEGSLSSSNINLDTTKLISDTKGVIDPVEDFLNYYIQDSATKDQFDSDRLNYIKNAFYSVKGAPQIFEIFQMAFGVSIEYEYEFPVLNIVSFDSLDITDVVLFVNKFKSLLYNLIYYTELTLKIKELVLNLVGNLSQKNQLGVRGFKNVSVELDNNGI